LPPGTVQKLWNVTDPMRTGGLFMQKEGLKIPFDVWNEEGLIWQNVKSVPLKDSRKMRWLLERIGKSERRGDIVADSFAK
jgi:hypothetical protein